MEQMSRSGLARLVFRDKSAIVNVPAKTALKRLSAFAEQCIQARTVTVESFSGRGFGGRYTRSDMHFRAHVAKEDGIDRLLILGDTDTSNLVIGDKDGFNVLTTTQVIPNGDATTLKTRHVVFWGRLHTAAVEWASGETSVCPDLSKLYRPL